jgi:protein-S-isoprenylcysteine O-methyltransferase Ste14
MKLRLRVTRMLVLPAAIFALLTHHTYPEDSLADATLGGLGLVLLVASAGGRIWASAYLTGRKNRTLVTTGPYSLVRNPLYFASFIGFVGVGLAFESVVLAGVFALTFFAAHWPTIGAEERALEELFGESYRTYRSEVPRFIPAFRRIDFGRGSSAFEGRGFANAVLECMAIPLVYVLAEAAEVAKLNGLLPVLLRLP